MKEQEKYLYYLIRCGVQNEKAKAPECTVDWQKLLASAVSADADTFVKYALKAGKIPECPEAIRRKVSDDIRMKAMGRIMAAGQLELLQKELEKRGIHTAVIKGQALASAYALPELRTGCDIDLYVDEKQEDAVYDWAQTCGHKVRRRVKGAHHGEIVHRTLGLIELHVSLSNADSALVEERILGRASLRKPEEAFTVLETCGSRITTLGMTDHMVFIIRHMINHYLHAEASLRMILDVNAFFTAYHEQIDVEKMWGLMDAMHYRKFLQTVFGIGVEWFGFTDIPEMQRNTDSSEIEALLQDFGTDTADRQSVMEIYDIYCSRAAGGRKDSLLYKMRLIRRNIIVARQLLGKVSISHILRLGAGRVYRLLCVRSEKNENTKMPETVRNRIQIMEKMKMF